MAKFIESQEYPSLQHREREDTRAFDLKVEVLDGMVQRGPRIPRACGRQGCDELQRQQQKDNI